MLAALSLRWGRPIAWIRRNLSAREFAFWRRYQMDKPLDDESVFHLPMAQIAMMYSNYHRKEGSAPRRLTDFLMFRQSEAGDIDEQLRSGAW